MKNVPNILSISRIAVSGLLFFLVSHPVLFTILYLYCGLSDIADGYLARRWNAESGLGANQIAGGDPHTDNRWKYDPNCKSIFGSRVRS